MLRANFTGNYGFDPVRFFDFERHIEKLKGITLYYGLGSPNTADDTNKKVLIDLETPNFIYMEGRYNPDEFDAIFMLCPLSVKYLNTRYATTKFHTMWFPIDLPPTLTLNSEERRIPVFYTGHSMMHFPILRMIDSAVTRYLGEFKTTLHNSISASNYEGYLSKLTVLSHTKVCLCHNVLHYNERLPNYLEKLNDTSYAPYFPWHGKSFDSVLCLPQLKSRVFEGALMGCVLLVYKDEYSTMDRYFEENKDFVYFTSEEDMNTKLDDILSNYSLYEPMAKSAQKKVLELYTTEKFIDYVVNTLNLPK
jgi:hypothetical protein